MAGHGHRFRSLVAAVPALNLVAGGEMGLFVSPDCAGMKQHQCGDIVEEWETGIGATFLG